MLAAKDHNLLRDCIPPEVMARWRRFFQSELAISFVELASVGDLLGEAGDEAFAAYFLHAEERKRFNSFHAAKRRVEWLGGRIAAKDAARLFEPMTSWRTWIILPDGSGKPLLSRDSAHGGGRREVSISHSGRYAVALVAGDRLCGIDLQQHKASILKVRRWFCHEDESALLAGSAALQGWNDIERLTLLWVAKEASKKCIDLVPLARFHELRLAGVAPLSPDGDLEITLLFQRGDHCGSERVVCSRIADYSLAVTVKNLLPE